MAGQPTPPVSIGQARDRAIEALSAHFAQDSISLEELEQRIERAYKAVSVAELDALTADLRGIAATVPKPAPPPRAGSPSVEVAPFHDHDRIFSIMSETKRRGVWSVPQDLDVFALMSDTTLDLTQATLPAGVIEIEVRAMMAAVKIIVPPGVHVVDRIHSFMATVSSNAHDAATPPPGAPVIRLSGFVMMTEVKVRVRRAEELPG